MSGPNLNRKSRSFTKTPTTVSKSTTTTAPSTPTSEARSERRDKLARRASAGYKRSEIKLEKIDFMLDSETERKLQQRKNNVSSSAPTKPPSSPMRSPSKKVPSLILSDTGVQIPDSPLRVQSARRNGSIKRSQETLNRNRDSWQARDSEESPFDPQDLSTALGALNRSASPTRETRSGSSSARLSRKITRSTTTSKGTPRRHNRFRAWNIENVTQWLSASGLDPLIALFIEHNIEGDAWVDLTAQDLEAYGVPPETREKFCIKREMEFQVTSNNRNKSSLKLEQVPEAVMLTKTVSGQSTRYPRFPFVETMEVRNRDWWEYLSHEEMWAIERASHNQRAPVPLTPTPSNFKTDKDINSRHEQQLIAWDKKPRDYETLVAASRYLDFASKNGDLFLFPKDDIHVKRYSRKNPTILGLDGPNVPEFVSKICEFYTLDTLLIKSQSRSYGGRKPLTTRTKEFISRMKKLEENSAASAASGASDFTSSESVSLDVNSESNDTPTNLSKRSSFSTSLNTSDTTQTPRVLNAAYLDDNLTREPTQFRESNEWEKRAGLHITGLFATYCPSKRPTGSTEKRSLPKPFAETKITILLEAKHFQMNIFPDEEPKEPFYISYGFFDVAKKVRLTEDFHVEFNDNPYIVNALGKFQHQKQDKESTSKRALFSFSQTNENIFFVVKVSRVFHDCDPDSADEYFQNSKSMTDKEKAKYLTENASQLVKFGAYRQPIAWAVAPAFDKNGTLLLGESQEIRMWKMKPVLTNEVLFEQITAMFSDGKIIKPPRPLKGVLTISAMSLSEPDKIPSFSHHLDVSLFQIPAQPAGHRGGILTQPVKEMTNFGTDYQSPYPHTSFYHNLFIYPLTVNLSNISPKYGTVQNILTRISFLDTDSQGEISSHALPQIFGRTKSPNFLATVDLPITAYKSKRAVYYDEVKIKLPFEISELHHILFHVYSVDKKGGEETLLGYGFLSLRGVQGFQTVIPTGDYTVPLFRTLVPQYMANQNLTFLDGAKAAATCTTTITLSVISKSSIYPSCAALSKLFRSAGKEIDSPNFWKLFETVTVRELVLFFPTVLTVQIEYLAVQTSKSQQQLAFRALVDLVQKIDQETRDPKESTKKNYANPLLDTYLNFVFTNGKLPIPVFHRVIQNWVVLMAEAALNAEAKALSDKIINDYSYFFFGMILRSIILNLKSRKQLRSDRKNRYPDFILSPRGGARPDANEPNLRTQLTSLVDSFIRIAEGPGSLPAKFNRNFSYFLVGLYDIIDRGLVTDLVANYFSGISQECHSRLRLQMIRIISDYEHYVPLITPTPTIVDSASTLKLKFWKEHYLAGLILNEIDSIALLNQEAATAAAQPTTSAAQHAHATLAADKESIAKGSLSWRAIRILRNTLWKHMLDSRYSSPKSQQLLATVYLPQLQQTSEHISLIYRVSVEEQRDWLVCWLFILRMADSNAIRQWWNLESSENVDTFLDVCQLTIDTFKTESLWPEVVRILTDWLEFFLTDFRYALHQPENEELFKKYSYLLLTLLKLSPSESLVPLFWTIRNFFFRCKSLIFRTSASTFTGDCCFELFMRCYDHPHEIVIYSVSLIYAMLKANYLETGDVLRAKLALVVAFSKFENSHYKNLTYLMDMILTHCRESAQSQHPGPDWELHIKDITSRLYRCAIYQIVLDQDIIDDPELKVEILDQMRQENNYSVALRVRWLEQLANYLKKLDRYDAVAQCQVTVAATISMFLSKKLKSETIPSSFSIFKNASPNVIFELPISDVCAYESVSSRVSELGFLESLDEAISSFEKASLFESAIEVLHLLFEYHKNTGQYQKLEVIGKKLQTFSNHLIVAVKNDTRLFNNYYRVGFYGRGFSSELNQSQYIYSTPASIRLNDFSERLLVQYSKSLKEEDEVKIITNKPKEYLEIDPRQNYLQIVAVDPYLPPSNQLSTFARQHHINEFLIETPYYPPGVTQSEDIDKQWKSRTIFETHTFFPSPLLRHPVVNQRTEILEPIDSAIDLISRRIADLKKELDKTANLKTLQIVLQGSIALQVNGGPLAIFKVFLARSREYPTQKINLLKTLLVEFLLKCQFALLLNGRIIDPTEKMMVESQTMMIQSYHTLHKEAESYLGKIPNNITYK